MNRQDDGELHVKNFSNPLDSKDSSFFVFHQKRCKVQTTNSGEFLSCLWVFMGESPSCRCFIGCA